MFDDPRELTPEEMMPKSLTEEAEARLEELNVGGEIIESPAPQVPMVRSSNLRTMAMSVPVEEMQVGLAKWKEKRDALREFILAELKEGTHYGFPPGCEPKTQKIDGKLHYGVWSKGRDGAKGAYKWYPPEQWTPKPPLYAAGAALVADLFSLVAVYDADEIGWQQLGSPKGTFIYRCRLYPREEVQTPETLVGEGRGARKVGQKGGDENNAVKMAMKSSLVSAVIDAFGLRDLFTQDDPPPAPQYETPEGDDSAPHAAGRDDRFRVVCSKDLSALWEAWSGWQGNETKEQFEAWCHEKCGRKFNHREPKQWKVDEFKKLMQEVQPG